MPNLFCLNDGSDNVFFLKVSNQENDSQFNKTSQDKCCKFATTKFAKSFYAQ